jgi:membrane protein required for colicin V production
MNQWTALDLGFALIIAVSTGFALTKGLAREVISLVALIGGFILAAFYYRLPAAWLSDLTRTEAIADLIGFMVIFLGTIAIGAVVSLLVNRFVKMASLQWIDRLLGGIFGFLRGWAVASILVLAMVAFPLRDNSLLARSYLAPYLLAGARAAVIMVPQHMKDRFHDEYQKVIGNLNHGGITK